MANAEQLAEVLIEFASTLVTDYSAQAILDRLVRRALDVVPVTGAGVLLMDADRSLRFVAASDEVLIRIESLQLDSGEGPCIEAYRTGEPVLIPDLGADQRFADFSPRARRAGLGAVFSFPMVAAQERLGALDLYLREPGQLVRADSAIAQLLADVAASYVFNWRAHEDARSSLATLLDRTLHDSLTGLPNRVLLHDRLEQAVAKAERSGAITAVLFVDLDRFKLVNDSHGHQFGDEVLKAVAERLRTVLRPVDTLARLSGDEFVIVCEDVGDSVVAEQMARRVANTLAEPLDLPPIGTIDLTASVGVAFAGKGVELPQQILHDADKAMYSAKHDGGGRYPVFDESVHATV